MSEAEIISKAALSRLCGISKARVSQYIGMGMPVRPDGRLNMVECLAWVRANILLPSSSRDVSLTDAELKAIIDG